jgi:hypothetical protein
MVTTGLQKITVWGPGGTPLGMLRVKQQTRAVSSCTFVAACNMKAFEQLRTKPHTCFVFMENVSYFRPISVALESAVHILYKKSLSSDLNIRPIKAKKIRRSLKMGHISPPLDYSVCCGL